MMKSASFIIALSIVCVGVGFAAIPLNTPVYPPNCYFDVQKDNESVWWLVDPNGKTFWSRGFDVINPNGEADKTTGNSLFRDTVESKYKTFQNWSYYQVDRFIKWNMNTMAAWTHEVMVDKKMPYTEVLGLYSKWKSDSGCSDPCYIPDFYDPGYLTTIRNIIRERVLPKAEDPYYMGHILDNEVFLGPAYFRNHHIIWYYVNFTKESYGWKEVQTFLKGRYSSISELNTNWNMFGVTTNGNKPNYTFTSFDQIHMIAMPGQGQNYLFERDANAFGNQTATAYIKTATQALKEADPNHLILGQKYNGDPVSYGPWVEANYGVDVGTIDLYRLPASRYGEIEKFYRVGLPVIFGEFTYRGNDTGHKNSGGAGPVVGNQAARGENYATFIKNAATLNYTVGAWWFQYVDQPIGGRYDGEDGNNGALNYNDTEYKPLVDAMTRVNLEIDSFHGKTRSLPAKCSPRLYCPNNCSGNGCCNKNTGRCDCHSHFSGGDCSYQTGLQSETFKPSTDLFASWYEGVGGNWWWKGNTIFQSGVYEKRNEGLAMFLDKATCLDGGCGTNPTRASAFQSKWTYAPGWVNVTMTGPSLSYDLFVLRWWRAFSDFQTNNDGYEFRVNRTSVTFYEVYGTTTTSIFSEKHNVNTTEFNTYSAFWGSDSSVKMAINGKVIFSTMKERVAKRAPLAFLYTSDIWPPSSAPNKTEIIIRSIIYETEKGNVAPAGCFNSPSTGASTTSSPPSSSSTSSSSPSTSSATGVDENSGGNAVVAAPVFFILSFIAIINMC